MMSDIRCPMCGRENPEELDVCQFCEARLKPLIIPSPSESDSDAKQGSAGSVTDWLNSLTDEDEGGSIPSISEPTHRTSEAQDESQVGEDDWLAGLRTESTAGETEDADEDDLEDWGHPEDEQGGGIPEWLNDLGREDSASEVPDADVSQEGKFLEEFETESVFQQVTGEEEDAVEVGSEELPSTREMEAQEIISEEFDSSESPFSSMDSGDKDEGFRELAGETESEFSLPDSQEAQGDELFPMEAEPSLETETVEKDDVPGEEQEGTPEWLAEIIEEETVTAAEAEGETELVPDWLAEIDDTSDLGVEVEHPTTEPEAEADYDWLDSVEEQVESETPVLETDGEPGVDPPFTFDEDVGEVTPGEDVPDWLADIPHIETGPEPEVIKEESEGLEQAELPSWLESMRPVEAAAPSMPFTEERETEAESSGPLAGLRGVLPVEREIVKIKKPSVYALKLQVSDQQRAHANLFDELIKGEGESQPVEKGAVISSQFLLRVVVFLLLLAAVIWPIYSGSQDVPVTEMPIETFEVNRMINSLTVGDQVMLAVDYEPGYSGELEAASATVLDNLMVRGTNLTIVSTSPNGPAIAERLIKIVNMNGGHNYQPGNQYQNLGYIPGGASGLQAFAQTPQQVLPLGIDGQPVWSTAPLDEIKTLADFSYVIVVTESPETGRAWIEQVQPTLGDAGLIMVISAQAEPLIRPYFEESANQIQGFVTGLSGGAAYESGMPRPMLARKYWDAFSYSLIAAVLIIVFGSTINTVSAYFMNRKQDGRKLAE